MNLHSKLSRVVLLTLLTLAVRPAVAQVSFSVGPHVSTLGVGISGEVRVTPLIGVSAEYNFFPVSNFERSGFNSEFLIEPTIGGAMVLVMLHPGGGRFGIGAGLLQGGASADATMALDPNASAEIEIGDGAYSASQVGTLLGAFEFGKTQPAFALGWLGGGLNFVLGAAIATPTLTLDATGPLANDPTFRADLDREISDFDDWASKVPVYPYIRLGWQFGF